MGKLAQDNPLVFFLRKIQLPLHKEAFLGHGLELHTCKLKILIDKLCLWVYNYFDEGPGKFIRTMRGVTTRSWVMNNIQIFQGCRYFCK